MAVTKRRVARKEHRCTNGHRIEPGEVYLEHVAFPSDDLMEGTQPWRIKECSDCACRYGRYDDLLPVPPGGLEFKYWLADGTPKPEDPLEVVLA